MTLCYRQMNSHYWHFLGDLLHAMFPSEDIVFPTRMANPRNRNRCRITLDLIACVKFLGHPCCTCIHTLGQVSKKAHSKETKVGNSGNLIYYQHENEALLEALSLSIIFRKDYDVHLILILGKVPIQDFKMATWGSSSDLLPS